MHMNMIKTYKHLKTFLNVEHKMVINTDVANSFLQNKVILLPKFFDSDASMMCSSNSDCIYYQGTNPLKFYESPHLHPKEVVGILVPISFWVHEG